MMHTTAMGVDEDMMDIYVLDTKTSGVGKTSVRWLRSEVLGSCFTVTISYIYFACPS